MAVRSSVPASPNALRRKPTFCSFSSLCMPSRSFSSDSASLSADAAASSRANANVFWRFPSSFAMSFSSLSFATRNSSLASLRGAVTCRKALAIASGASRTFLKNSTTLYPSSTTIVPNARPPTNGKSVWRAGPARRVVEIKRAMARLLEAKFPSSSRSAALLATMLCLEDWPNCPIFAFAASISLMNWAVPADKEIWITPMRFAILTLP